MAYLLRNISAKKYWNRTTIVEIIIGGWVVSFFLRHSVVLAEQTHNHFMAFFRDFLGEPVPE